MSFFRLTATDREAGVLVRVWLQTELDDTKSCCQLIIDTTLFEVFET